MINNKFIKTRSRLIKNNLKVKKNKIRVLYIIFIKLKDMLDFCIKIVEIYKIIREIVKYIYKFFLAIFSITFQNSMLELILK
jgi:hypothetical protein